MNTTALIAIFAAAIGPLLVYIAAIRKASGKVASSEAADLWAESAAIRKDYKDRIAELERRIERFEDRDREMQRELDDCKLRSRDLALNCDRLRKERDAAIVEVEMLKRTIRGHLT